MQGDPLAQLRDIYLPDDPSWWPLAPGWWILGLVIIAALVSAFYQWKKYQGHQMAKRQAIAALKQLDLNADSAARDINEILKRACLSYLSRREVAALHGEQWLQILKQAAAEPVSDEQLSLWLTAGYRQHTDAQDRLAFHRFSLRWIEHALPPKKSSPLVALTQAQTTPNSSAEAQERGSNL